ncbi:hypothetical protein [Nocardia sp. NPDC051570]|uniref:hypothetical protein n=1 Tax=Nocardia sp. NPDC051570 TaxID=3364324 RepID=UPI00379CC72C
MQITDIRLLNQDGELASAEGFTYGDAEGRHIVTGRCVLTRQWPYASASLSFRPQTVGVVVFRPLCSPMRTGGAEVDLVREGQDARQYRVSQADIGTTVTVPEVLSYSWDQIEGETNEFAFWVEF